MLSLLQSWSWEVLACPWHSTDISPCVVSYCRCHQQAVRASVYCLSRDNYYTLTEYQPNKYKKYIYLFSDFSNASIF
jgi:hypothetical protein